MGMWNKYYYICDVIYKDYIFGINVFIVINLGRVDFLKYLVIFGFFFYLDKNWIFFEFVWKYL